MAHPSGQKKNFIGPLGCLPPIRIGIFLCPRPDTNRPIWTISDTEMGRPVGDTLILFIHPMVSPMLERSLRGHTSLTGNMVRNIRTFTK
jgi:hypothetical protein